MRWCIVIAISALAPAAASAAEYVGCGKAISLSECEGCVTDVQGTCACLVISGDDRECRHGYRLCNNDARAFLATPVGFKVYKEETICWGSWQCNNMSGVHEGPCTGTCFHSTEFVSGGSAIRYYEGDPCQ